MKKRISFLFLFLILCALPSSSQKIGHITLLAVSEATQIGSTADLYLRVQKGSGGVYIDTFPLTKLDTQLSTRFAQQIACDFLEKDCSKFDFFYTIRSDATIIGGPSAGAALATMTVAMLDNLEINESVAITGTINVGGLIGPVGSLMSKIDAAQKKGITKVLIPKGSRYESKPEQSYNERLLDTNASFYRTNNETNTTDIDLYAYGDVIGVQVREVATLQEAVYEITGKKYALNDEEIIPESWYTESMQQIAADLCNRSRVLLSTYEKQNKTAQDTNQTEIAAVYDEITNATIRAENASAYGQYYVAASTCFGTNIKINYLILQQTTTDRNATVNMTVEINQTLADLKQQTNNENLETITDLQTYLVVNERLEEAEETLHEIYVNFGINLQNDLAYDFSYATERLYSAKVWSRFFSNDGKKLQLDTDALRESCMQKLAEAQERYQYVRLITEQPMDAIVGYLDRANEEYDNQNFVLCLDHASRAKANLDILMSLFGVADEAQLTELVDERLKLVRQVLNKEQHKGYFPMLGYSYYEYAVFLREKDPYSALIYSHYALEFSNLDMYFKEKKGFSISFPTQENMLYFLLGFSAALVCYGIFLLFTTNKQDKRKEKPKREEVQRKRK